MLGMLAVVARWCSLFYAALRGVASRRLLRFNDMLTFTASLHGGEVGADAHLLAGAAAMASFDIQLLPSSIARSDDAARAELRAASERGTVIIALLAAAAQLGLASCLFLSSSTPTVALSVNATAIADADTVIDYATITLATVSFLIAVPLLLHARCFAALHGTSLSLIHI